MPEPKAEWSNENWELIEVFPIGVDIAGKCFWCNAQSTAKVIRVSRLTGHRFEDFACEEHAKGWLLR